MTWVRVLVWLLLVQLACVQLWPALHHALFAHAVCAEHGELVHVSAHADHAAALPSETAVARALGGIEDDAHEHCKLPPGTCQTAAEPAALTVVDAASAAASVTSVAERDAQPGAIPLLSLAPKQSPPS